MTHRIRPTQITSVLGVMLAILVALALRWQSVPVVRNGWLDTDVYRFVRQAQIISETGGLPERDDMRWLPRGRDLTRQLSFSSYCLAGLYTAMRWIQPTTPLPDAALWYPLLCFALSLVVLYFLVNRLFNRATALLATLLFAIFPTVLFRSTAGYADRDSLCLLLGMVSYLCLIQALAASSNRGRHLWAWLSGTAQMLLNATWEGSGLFSAVVAGFFIFKVLWGQITRAHGPLYLGWALPGLASLLLWTKTYHSLAPYAILAWGAPLLSGFAIGIYLAYHYLFTRVKKARHFVGHLPPGVTALGSAVLLISVAVGVLTLYPVSTSEVLRALWDNFQSPLGKSRLMRSVGELYNPYTTDWVKWYGVSFLVLIVGTLLAVGSITRFLGINLWVGLISWQVLIGGIVYSRFSPTTPLRGDDLSQHIFSVVVFAFLILLVIQAWRAPVRGELEKRLTTVSILDESVFALIWFIIMLLAARGAQRYHFFFAPIGVAFLSYALIWPLQYLRRHQSTPLWKWPALCVLFVCIGFLSVTFTRQCFRDLKILYPTPPAPWREAMNWMKESLPPKSVIAAWWDYGSQINLIGNQATIIDEDHFIPYWIHLMARHVFCTQKAEEALTFLKTHNVSYLAMSAQDLRILRTISILGSDETVDRLTMEPVYLATSEKPFLLRQGGYVIRFSVVNPVQGDFVLSIPRQGTLPADGWVIQGATLQFDAAKEGDVPVAASVNIQSANGRTFAAFPQRLRLDNKVIKQKGAPLPGTLVCFSPSIEEKDSVWQAFYLSENAEKLVSVRLILLGEEFPSFHRVYPTDLNIPLPPVGI